MRNGLPPKLGDWYEEEYLVFQLLRLLAEQIQQVEWEPRVAGLDLRIREDGADIGIQCKHRTSLENWTFRKLAGKGVLEYIRRFLEAGQDREFRFVSDRAARDLESLVSQAKRAANPGEWWASCRATAAKLAEEWKLDLAASRTPNDAFDLVRRIHVQILNRAALQEQCRNTARLLAGAQGDRLLDVLRQLGRSGAEISRPMRVEDLRAAIDEAGVRIQPRGIDPFVHDRLLELSRSFREQVAAARFLEPITRSEVQAARDKLDSMNEPGTLLIHGPAGSGKTEVISALTEVLEAQGWVVLAATPDRLLDLHLHDDPIATLKRHADTKRAVLVLDQLDAVLRAGAGAHSLLVPTREAVLRARNYGVYVVAGCRTVDATRETQLRLILQTHAGEEPEQVAVGDLEEVAYGRTLSEAGIALADLYPGVRSLAARPIHLRLLCRLLEHGVDLCRIDGLPPLMDAWWELIERDLSRQDLEAFDEIVDRMEREGRLRVDASGLSRPGALPTLEAATLITVESDGKLVRPTHQLLLDMRIAHRWRGVRTPEELLEKLGGRQEQSLHTAGRLRLAVSLLRGHSRSIACFRAVAASAEVRPLVKRSLYKALAEVEDPRDREVRMLIDWYRAPGLGAPVLLLVARGSPGWVGGLAEAGWFQDLWAGGREDERRLALDLLASVSETWGDGVAELLGNWAEGDPEVLHRASWIFLQAPGKDTDKLFEMRLQSVARGSSRMSLINWAELLEIHPERAVRLLAARLPREDVETIRGGDTEWSQLFPGPKDLSLDRAADLGHTAWDFLRGWWCGLGDVDLNRVQTADEVLPTSLLVRVVELLARCLAHALDHREIAWRELLRELPDPLRDIDGWLLLRTGASLKVEGTGVPEAVIGWLQSEVRWPVLKTGYGGLRWDLARECVGTVSSLATDDGYRELEDWIIDFRDAWTAEDEARRWSTFREYGVLLPSLGGALAYHLIPALPEGKRGLRTRRLLLEVQRKFTERADWVFRRYGTTGGLVAPRVSMAAAARWSPSQWKEQLAGAPEVGKWPEQQESPNSIRVHERSTLLGLLFSLAHQNPAGFLEHAREFDDPEFDRSVAGRARRRVLLAIESLNPPSVNPPVPHWAPLSDSNLASVVRRPVYLNDEDLAGTIGRIVRERPSHAWSQEVVSRLEEIAASPPLEPSDGTREFGVSYDRLNDDGNIAFEALAALAWLHPEHRSRVLDLAERCVSDPNPARRAAAAMAAWAARDSDLSRADRLVLQAAEESEVAAQHDVCSYLLHLVGPDCEDEATRSEAKSRLLALVEDPRPHVAEWGGKVLVVLRELAAVDDEKIAACSDAGVEVRRGLADHVARYLAQGRDEAWLQRLAVRLGDDEDEKVRGEIARMFSYRDAYHLLDHREFIRELKATRALKEAPYDLLKLCDRSADLTPVAALILDLVRNLDLAAGSETGYSARHLSADQACGLLFRLTEEAERTGDLGLRSEALDAWDRLLEAGSYPAASRLEELWHGS